MPLLPSLPARAAGPDAAPSTAPGSATTAGPGPAFVVALLGAKGTGKTTLAHELAAALAGPDTRTTWVPEALRAWCDAAGRTPARHEQAAIAEQQAGRIAVAAAGHDIVVTDSTALMVAVRSDLIFSDPSLLASAAATQRRYGLTLLTALDLPCPADGQHRDDEPGRGAVDAGLRRELMRHGIAFSVVRGTGPTRLQNALAAVTAARRPPAAAGPTVRWRHVCARCGDPDCERHLLAGR
jgi:nicotinamide riboside kinase